MIDYRAALNDAQYAAVTYLGGPELVIAGAGSGKTRVLTYKVAYLLEQGLDPERILMLTFTKKASNEMKQRVNTLLSGDHAARLFSGTFHSVFARILKNVALCRPGLLPYSPHFSIYDQEDSIRVIKDIIEKMSLDEKKYAPSYVASRISTAKNHMIIPDQYTVSTFVSMYEQDVNNKVPAIHNIYKSYQQSLVSANAMDFDDILLNIYLLFKDHELVRREYADFFRYCLVDEYQDTNFLQKEILCQLTRERRKLCAVGDDAQSIYAFRGAVIDNILNFDKDFPGVRTFKMEENYRSTKSIVGAANSLISNNKRQIAKNLFTKNGQGKSLGIHYAATDIAEAYYVTNVIQDMVRDGHWRYEDFTILYRSNWLSRVFEKEFKKHGIPYKVYSGTGFYQRKEVKDMLSYFRVVVNPSDEQALRRIINYPTRGLGSTTIDKLIDLSVRNERTLWDTLTNPRGYSSLFSKSTVTKLLDFVHMVKGWQLCLATDAYTLATLICRDIGIITFLENSKKKEDQDRVGNIEELLSDISSFVNDHRSDADPSISLEDYIREISLFTDEEEHEKQGKESLVKLMTIHGSKGLEFPVVFITGLCEDIFPDYRSMNSPRDLEEERRLMYVALTRAKQQCFLTLSKYRFRNGHQESFEPSRFIGNIDNKFF